MSRTSAMMTLAAALAGLANPAWAAPNIEDMRCFMVSNAFANSAKDAKGKQVAAFVRFYSLGKIQASVAPSEMKAAIVQAGKTLTIASAPGIMTTCAANLAAAERAINAVGQQLQPPKAK